MDKVNCIFELFWYYQYTRVDTMYNTIWPKIVNFFPRIYAEFKKSYLT